MESLFPGVSAKPESRRKYFAVPDHTGGTDHATPGPSVEGRVDGNHCQVLALPLTHSPEGGSQWCRITRGVPSPQFLGVEGRMAAGCGRVGPDPRHRQERERQLLRTGLFGMPAPVCEGAPLSLGRFLGRRTWGLKSDTTCAGTRYHR